MYTAAALLALSAAAMAQPTSTTAAPPAYTSEPAKYFQVSDFVFGCTVTCDWYFNVTVQGSAANHPSFDTPVECHGSLDSTTGFTSDSCGYVSDTQQVAAYIEKSSNTLNLQYKVNNIFQGATYWYEGAQHVNAATSGLPQDSAFEVPESKAYAVA